ncbi:MAG: HAD-IIIA family hydrolase [Verrucomicrobiia bacterium]
MGINQITTQVRAIFLDRDGVLNVPLIKEGKPYPPQTLEAFEIYPEAVEACHLLKKQGFLLIVVTNQPDVERGTQFKPVIEAMHSKMNQLLPLDHIEVCYDSGNTASDFRKPAPGMILKTAKLFNVDLSQSFMIGDRWRDIDCGYNANCKTIFINQEIIKKS